MILQQAGHGESVTRDCGMGSAGLPAGPDSPALLCWGARAHAHLSRFTAGAVHWATGPPGLGGKWEPSLVARRATGHGNADVGGSQAASRHQAWAAG